MLAELALILAVFPDFETDLRRTWSPLIAATDASVVFGFGASIAKCTPRAARQVGRLAEIQGGICEAQQGRRPDR